MDTFRRSVLDWAEPDGKPHRELLEWHRSLIALRRAIPELNDPRTAGVRVEVDDNSARWLMMWRGGVCVAANLGGLPVLLPASAPGAARPRLLLASDPAIHLDTDGIGDSGTASLALPAASVAVLG
ncbi:DUF3459 domain-containing protein [Actinomadura madurae]|uniref:DUF3459 domain-containing protein n=1 Tax=Actinomadura madurae TaxID=1993 RepID=UPI0020D2599F|nr:DUF3459 domain-containing protein [Actinomadura madurae]MCQ0016053.1 DUF3459 domain-containing protein [Actinomadura madurae]